MALRPMSPDDWPRVREIYLEGIATGDATFQSTAPTWEEWDGSHLQHSRLIASSEAGIVGWAALSPVSSRCVYGGVAEVSIYVAQAGRGLGVGKDLLDELVQESERNGIWTLQAGIFPENEPSVRLHQRCGFRIVGTKERLGQMHGRWRDVMQLERRSKVVGVNSVPPPQGGSESTAPRSARG